MKIREYCEAGYLIVQHDIAETIHRAFLQQQTFFASSVEYKNRFFQPKIEVGYKKLNEKELYVSRRQSPPKELMDCDLLQDSFEKLTLEILKFIAQKMNWSSDLLYNLLDISQISATQMTTSVLRLFHYHPRKEQLGLAADAHTDIGLLTIIPKSTLPALEVYVFDNEGQWRNVEITLADNECIVLFGELLGKISNYKLMPTLHRVKQTTEPRYSIVYQARARLDAKLDSVDFENDKTGRFADGFKLSVQQFVFSEQSKVTSVNELY